jgi:hypothetical protein
MAYAEGTKVPVSQSRGEITGILAKHGVEVMGWGTRPDGDALQFELAGRVYRLTIPKPTDDDILRAYPNVRDVDAKREAEWRRRWRANVLLLKAKLEFADGETSTVERELMPYMLLNDGRTLETALSGLPLLASGA